MFCHRDNQLSNAVHFGRLQDYLNRLEKPDRSKDSNVLSLFSGEKCCITWNLGRVLIQLFSLVSYKYFKKLEYLSLSAYQSE